MKTVQKAPSEDVQWALGTTPGKRLEEAAQATEKALAGYESVDWAKLPAPARAKVQDLRTHLDRLTRITTPDLSDAVISQVAGARTLAALRIRGSNLDFEPSASVFRSYQGAVRTWLSLEASVHERAQADVWKQRAGRSDGHGYQEDINAQRAVLRAKTPGYAEARKQVVAHEGLLSKALYSREEIPAQKLGLIDRSAQSLYAQASDIIAMLEATGQYSGGYKDTIEVSYVPKDFDALDFSYHASDSTLTREGLAVVVDQVAYLARIRSALLAQHPDHPSTKKLDDFCSKITLVIREGKYRTTGGKYEDARLSLKHPGDGIMNLARSGFYPAELARLVASEYSRGSQDGVSVKERPLAGSKPV